MADDNPSRPGFDAGSKAGAHANMAKSLGSRAAVEPTEGALQTHRGYDLGYGFSRDHDIITPWPSVRLMETRPSTTECCLTRSANMSSACPNPGETRDIIARDGFTAPDGRDIVLWRWPQSDGRPTLHWAHATGFHGRLYEPLLDALASDCNVLAWDMRGHGASAGAADTATFRGWETYYQDLTAWLESLDEPVWLAGHSIGATTSIMAAARRPDKVLGLILAEPVIMDRRQGWQLWLAKLLRQSHRISLAAGAGRRRRMFDSRAAALENFRGRGGFRTWPEAWLEAYVQHGLAESGDRVRLACAPEWESTTFAHTEHNPWPGIGRLRCPVMALAAERASTFSPRARRHLRALLPSAEVNVLAGTTHFLPMERPEAVRDAVRQAISWPHRSVRSKA